MNYHQYMPVDVINGKGTRATLFVSGCEHQCRGCYNQSTWKVDSGTAFDSKLEQQIIDDLNDDRIKRKGLSLSGGDPLFMPNLDTILSLVKRVKAECPGKDIWLWSGYTFEMMSAKQREILNYVDVLIDGRFEQALKDPKLLWRGSSNQRVIELNDELRSQLIDYRCLKSAG